MPLSTYLPEHMGSATLTPSGPFVAGSHAELTLTYTAGTFGIDDSGMLKVSWRTTSDMAKPQFSEPSAPNYTTVEASNGAKLEYWIERLNIRPWVNTLLIRVGRGFLRAGDTLTVRFGDRRQGSPGLRLQTNCEERFELKVYVDAFATYEFTELPLSPGFALVPGPAVRWKAILPSLVDGGRAVPPRHRGRGPVGQSDPDRRVRSLSCRRGRSRTCLPVLLQARRTGRAFSITSRSPSPAMSSCASTPRPARSSRAPIRCASSPARRCGAIGATCTARAARRSAPIRPKATSATRATRRSSISSDTRATTFRSPTRSGRSSTA